jgi:hydrogenase maturation protease
MPPTEEDRGRDVMMRVMVLALGNPILGDDGVAFHVLELMRPRLRPSDGLVLDGASTGGIDLLPYLKGFTRVLIIDAVKTRREAPGTVLRFSVEDFRESLHADSPHHTNLATAVELGHRLHPQEMPAELAILGIEVDRIHEFREDLTPAVESAVGPAAREALEILSSWGVEVRPAP